MSGYVDHGHRHARGGTDPIPSPSLEVSWPTIQAWHGLSLFGGHMSNELEVVIDPAAPYNMYARHENAYAADYPGDPWAVDSFYFVLPALLGKFDGVSGPEVDTGYNGVYQIQMLFRTGPDCPIVDVDVASAAVGGMIRSVWDTDLSWVTLVDDHDLYAASSSWGDPYSAVSANFVSRTFRLTGDAGDQATSYSGGGQTLNGGAGVYYFQIRRVGKNASSSDYELNCAHFAIGLTHASA